MNNLSKGTILSLTWHSHLSVDNVSYNGIPVNHADADRKMQGPPLGASTWLDRVLKVCPVLFLGSQD